MILNKHIYYVKPYTFNNQPNNLDQDMIRVANFPKDLIFFGNHTSFKYIICKMDKCDVYTEHWEIPVIVGDFLNTEIHHFSLSVLLYSIYSHIIQEYQTIKIISDRKQQSKRTNNNIARLKTLHKSYILSIGMSLMSGTNEKLHWKEFDSC